MSRRPAATKKPALKTKSPPDRPTFPPGRKLLFAAVPCLLLLLLGLAVAEIALRVRYGRIERITGVVEWKLEAVEGGLTYFWDRYHPTYGWTSLAGYRSDERVPFQVTINSQALCAGVDYAPVAPPDVRRIAVFGDSCTFGEEVDDHETVPACLQQQFDGVEVINYGVRAFGFGQMALRLEHEGFELNPDLVLFMVLLPGNIRRDLVPYFAHNKPVFSVDGPDLRISNVPVPEASRQPWLLRKCFTAAWLFGRPKEPFPTESGIQAELNVAHAILRRVQEVCAKHSVPFALITIVAPPNIEAMRTDATYRSSMETLRQSLSQTQGDVLDMVPHLEQMYAAEGPALAAPLGHWSPRANCLIAREVSRHLVKRDPSLTLRLDRPTCYDDAGR